MSATEWSTNAIARGYVANERELKAADAEVTRLKTKKNEMQAVLLERFAEEGVQRINVDGATVYLHNQLWAGREEGVDAEQAHEVLLGTEGLEPYAQRTVNASAISALFREWDKKAYEANRDRVPHPEGEGHAWTLWDFTPATLKGVFKTSVQSTVRVQGA